MLDEISNIDRLYEELTLTKTLEEPTYPDFQNFGKNSKFWSFSPSFTVPGRWNPENKKNVVFRNSARQLHRVYGPALINKLYDIECWFYEDKLHRIGGPAYTHKQARVYFNHGKLHNLEGAAVVDPAGPLQYWIDGIKYTRKQYLWEINRKKLKNLI